MEGRRWSDPLSLVGYSRKFASYFICQGNSLKDLKQWVLSSNLYF